MILIPASYIKLKNVNYEAEAVAVLGQSLQIEPGFSVPPPCLGVYTVLELFESNFFLNPSTCSGEDVAKALYCFCAPQKALSELQAEPDVFVKNASALFLAHSAALMAKYPAFVEFTLRTPFLGFEMLPQNEDSELKEFIFDAEYLASVLGTVCMTTGADMEYVLWKMPLALAGHIVAFRARFEGRKGVGRKESLEDYHRVLAETMDREKHGELHPWQIDYPEYHSPTEEQIAARPEIIDEYLAILRSKRGKKHVG